MLQIYDFNTLQLTDMVDLREMNLPYFDAANRESGFGYIITEQFGKLRITKDYNFFMPARGPEHQEKDQEQRELKYL